MALKNNGNLNGICGKFYLRRKRHVKSMENGMAGRFLNCLFLFVWPSMRARKVIQKPFPRGYGVWIASLRSQ
jgi:hypothetical protein